MSERPGGTIVPLKCHIPSFFILSQKTISPDQIFVLARILFLSTALLPAYIVTLVENKYNGRTIIEIIAAKLDLLSINVQNSTRMAKEAMTDLLKFTYNFIHHYPKVRFFVQCLITTLILIGCTRKPSESSCRRRRKKGARRLLEPQARRVSLEINDIPVIPMPPQISSPSLTIIRLPPSYFSKPNNTAVNSCHTCSHRNSCFSFPQKCLVSVS